MASFKASSLKIQIPLKMLAIGFLLSIILTLITYYFSYKNDMARLDEQFQQVSNSFVDGISTAVWTLDKELTGIQLKGITELSGFVYASIKTNGDTFTYRGISPTDEGFIQHEFPLSHTIRDEIIEIGVLTVVADPNKFHKHAIELSLKLIVIQLLFMFTLVYFISVLVNQLILKYLEQMSQFMRRSNWQNFDAKFTLDRPTKFRDNELDVLAKSFNYLISKIQQFESELKISENRLSKTFDSSPDAIIVSRQEDGLIIDVNKGFERQFGFLKNEAIGKTSFELNVWVKPEIRNHLLAELRNTGSVDFQENQYRRKTGEIRDCVASSEAIHLNDIPCIVSTFRDITQQKANQLALRTSEQKFHSAFTSSPYPIAICQLEDGKLIEANQAAVKLFEFDSFSLVGNNVLNLPIWPNDATKKNAIQLLLKKGRVQDINIDLQTQKGTLLHCQLSAQIIKLDQKRIVVIIMQDVTKRKKAEGELLRSRESLRNLANRIEAIREEERIGIARELHDVLGQMLTGLKIDLSTVCNETALGEKAQNMVTNMNHNIDETIDIVRKISSDLRPPVLDDLGLIAAIEWVTLQFCERTSIQYQLNIHCDDLIPNNLRDTAIFRIYQEALTNIARHSRADSFELTLNVVKDKLYMIVKDNGVGITDDKIQDLNSIGLIGMQERASLLNGYVEVKNSIDGGTVVNLVIPILPK